MSAEMCTVSVRLSREQREKLEEVGRREYRTPSQLVRMAVDRLIEELGRAETAEGEDTSAGNETFQNS